MTMEVRLSTQGGETVYRKGVREITNGSDRIWLAFDEEAEGTAAADVLAGESEEFPGASIEVVKLEGGESLQEQDELVEEWAEKHSMDTEK